MILAAAILLSPSAEAPAFGAASGEAATDRPEPTEAQTAQTTPTCNPLSLRERAAQTVLTGIPGTRMTDTTRTLVARHAGSVVLSGENIEGRRQVRRLIGGMRRHARARLLVAVDEEGGRVSRLGSEGLVTYLPSARRLARTRSAAEVRRLGARLGRQMSDLGFDWNFAPVLDVTDAPDYTVIGDRSYSDDPDRAARYGLAFARGLRSGGILTTGKHFPGHGRTAVDSHERLPTVRTSLRRLWRRDLEPYRVALPALDTVMSAHVRYTALDEKHPASLSRPASRLLRQRIGFGRLLITDALDMGAITNRMSIVTAAKKAISRGADVALVKVWSQADDATSRLAGAVRSGRLSRSRLDHAAGRVLRAKGYGREKIACLLG